MISTHNFPALPVAVPLIGAAALAALRKWLSRAAADSLAIAVAAANVVFTSVLAAHALHYTQVYWFGGWYPRGSTVLGITFVVDPVGAGLALLASVLTLLALIFSWRFVDSGGDHYQPLMLVFLAAMSGFVLTGDLFNLFVFFELMSTAAFALCGLKTGEPAPLQGSFNFAVTNTVAAFLGLTGIAMLYSSTGALNMAQIGLAIGQRHDPVVIFAFTLLACGFLTKAAIVPFHLWLPDAHAVAPTPVCVLFSGLMVELGIYAIVRLHSVIFQQAFSSVEVHLRYILLAFGGVTVILGGIMCYAEHHLKRLLAFSTICHAGLMLVAFAIQGPLAIAALLIYLVAHAFVKSSLFFVTGIILHRLRSMSEQLIFRKGVTLHWTAVLWFLGGTGLAAAPPFSTLLGEAGASSAAERAGVHGISWLFLFGGILTGAAVFRVGMHTFFGWGTKPLTDRAAQVDEMPETGSEDKIVFWYHFVPPAICLGIAATLTFLPHWQSTVAAAGAQMYSQAAYLHTVYTGVRPPLPPSSWASEIAGPEITGAALRGVTAVVLALALACTSVFRLRLKRYLRIGAFLEGPLPALRAFQSGHPGDYVLWITVGVALFGLASMFLLR
jgi:multicomponent Na+:H+ antiporter subunit D